MIQTKRHQENQIMSVAEKEEYVRIIKTLPQLYRPMLKELERVVGSRANTLLDVACGNGYLLHLIHEHCPNLELTGIDTDKFFINLAKKYYPFDFFVSDAYSFLERADIITCNLALHHLDQPEDAVRHMYESAQVALLISDQIRPASEKELEARLQKRKRFVKSGFEYYEKHERESILEAYSKEEVVNILKKTRIPFKVEFLDEDYYERLVAVAQK